MEATESETTPARTPGAAVAAAAIDASAIERFVEAKWDQDIVGQLVEYIRIPNKSPMFDADWASHGYMDAAVRLMESWARAQPIPGMTVEVVRLDGRTPLIFLDIPASDPRSGASGAILGFPQNGPYDVRPGRVGSTRAVITQDAYGRGPVQRSIVTLRGTVRPGNSGGPLVDARGRVAATVFAATRGGTPGGYGVPNSVVERELRRAGEGSVSTGPCAR